MQKARQAVFPQPRKKRECPISAKKSSRFAEACFREAFFYFGTTPKVLIRKAIASTRTR